jgi:hypothetical protein
LLELSAGARAVIDQDFGAWRQLADGRLRPENLNRKSRHKRLRRGRWSCRGRGFGGRCGLRFRTALPVEALKAFLGVLDRAAVSRLSDGAESRERKAQAKQKLTHHDLLGQSY